jgi:hypothetical protein
MAERLSRHGTVDLRDDAQLIAAVKSGIIWRSPEAVADGLKAIRSGKVDLADCRNIPNEIVELLTASK